MVFLNGQIVPDDQAKISVFDRSFLYGDGLFETVRIHNGQPFRWRQHWQRLERGAEVLGIRIPFSAPELARQSLNLIRLCPMPSAMLRITLSRGIGLRGYSRRGADEPVLVMSLHEAPPMDPKTPAQWRLVTSTLRLAAGDRFAQVKSCSKLYQVLARAEAEARGAEEALLLNTDGELAEGTSSNLFWSEHSTVYTTPLSSGALAGVSRAVVLELCNRLAISICERPSSPATLKSADGVFLSLSSRGVVEAIALDDEALSRSPVTLRIYRGYLELAAQETGAPG